MIHTDLTPEVRISNQCDIISYPRKVAKNFYRLKIGIEQWLQLFNVVRGARNDIFHIKRGFITATWENFTYFRRTTVKYIVNSCIEWIIKMLGECL